MTFSPSFIISSSISRAAFSISSSILAGCILPSTTRRSIARRAISRRIGSKLESVTASGVSSMMRSTPVRLSNVRMFLPSRPIMRPFISSDGNGTTLMLDSPALSTAHLCIAPAIMSRAFLSASRCAFSSSSFSLKPNMCFASASVLRIRRS